MNDTGKPLQSIGNRVLHFLISINGIGEIPSLHCLNINTKQTKTEKYLATYKVFQI